MIRNKPPLRKIILSSSSDESGSNIASDAEAPPTNSNINQQKTEYSYEYEYSDSSDFDIPQIKPSTPKNQSQQNTNKAVIVPKRNITPIRTSPKRMIIESNSESDQDENSPFTLVNAQSTDNQTKDVQLKSTQQEEEISTGISDTINIDENSSNNKINNENDNDIDEPPNNVAITDQVEQKIDDSKYYSSYFCSKMNLKSPVDFTFSQKNSSFLYAKSKGIFSSHVYISSDKNFSMKSIKDKQYEYVMKITKNRSHFALRKGEDKTNLLVMIFDNDYGDELGPRKITMEWPNQQLKYLSRIPKKKESGNWELNFNGKYVLASQKNAIILDENSKPVIMIRKVQKSMLQVEVIHCIEPIYLFALGIASFLCPF